MSGSQSINIGRRRFLPVVLGLLLYVCMQGATARGPWVLRHLAALASADGKVLPEAIDTPPDGFDAALDMAVRNLALTYVGENWMGPEPPEVNPTIGAYTAACIWYELMFGEPPSGKGYIPLHMEYDTARMEIARLCAHAACLNPFEVTDVGYHNIKVNFNEETLPPYSLPDPLRTLSGRRVKNARLWMKRRRGELLSLFEREMFGRAPEKPQDLHFETIYTDRTALEGKAVRKEVKVHFDRSGEHYLRLMVYTPFDAEGVVPVFLGINFKGNWAVSPEEGILLPTERELKAYGRVETLERGDDRERWPLQDIIAAGYGVATFYRGDVDPDYDDVFSNGVHPLFYRSGQDYPDPDEWGTIAAWAWGLRRALDYLETDPDVDASRVAVIGHSRLGKTALWAGAQDERFAMVISNCSGNCGAALSRRRYGETIRKVNEYRPQWFCDNFLKYNDREDDLPFDQHELIALCAPRPVYVASATEDRNADPKGEFMALQAAAPVYRLFCPTQMDDRQMPPPDTPISDGPLGYHIHTGRHAITRYDWLQYISFADKYLKYE